MTRQRENPPDRDDLRILVATAARALTVAGLARLTGALNDLERD